MRLSLTVSVISFSLLIAGSVNAEPFIPKINQPESYKDIKFGLSEMRQNIDGVQCGGWDEDSTAKITTEDKPPACFPVFSCRPGVNTCKGYTGFTETMNSDGSIPICLSDSDAIGGQWDYLILHELTHAKQFCDAGPGEIISNTAAECCAMETEAYQAQCNAEASDGLFNNPINGIQLTVDNCVSYGINNVSCSHFGANPCNSDTFEPGFGAAYLAAITNSPRGDCTNMTTNPSPRVKNLIEDITDTTFGGGNTRVIVEGDVPLPDISPDIPGRRNSGPLKLPTGGLGERGAFEYPDSAWGYSSACSIYHQSYVDDDLKRLNKELKINEDGSVELIDGAGKVDINPFGWCIRTDKATPKFCKRLYDAWHQAAAIMPREDVNNPCPCPEPNDGCPGRPEKRYCFDNPYTFECHGTSEKRQPIPTTWPDTPPQDTTCRTTWDREFFNKMTECHVDVEQLFDEDGNPAGIMNHIRVDKWGSHWAIASSYYRHYAEAFMVPKITVTAPGGDNVWNVRAECYEYYKEKNADGSDFDPKKNVTSQSDEQCEFVIATEGEQNPRKPEWKEGDGHEQKETVKAEASVVEESPRDSRTSPEPWVPDTDTNLMMIDIKTLKEKQAKFDDPTDVTAILGTLLTTRQTASKTIPKNARTDQFDDSAERKMAIYFEAQQRELLKMTADPQTRLIMPARFLVGLADDDPLFQYVSHTVSRSDGTVEITLKAGLEDIGNVLKSFQRIFVAPIQEVRIPVLVPLASVTEIDARIADWKLWKKDETREAAKTGRASNAGGVDDLITKLEDYRDRTEEIRLMRGALTTYLVKLYDSQKQIREYFADWYEQNSVLLVESAERAVQRRELKRIWRLLQRAMLQTDSCQMLWCSNQRYSAPVYSLLDNWWGEAEGGEKRDRDYEPESLTDLAYSQPKDQLFNFSDVKFPRDPWQIPVLWPVQVRVELPVPPAIGAKPPSADDFPDLPELPDDKVFDSFPVPTVNLPEKSLITPPSTSDLEPAKDILRKFRKMIDGTEIDDQISEENSIAAGASIDAGDDNFPLDRDSMRGAYCRFPPSILIPPDSKDAKYYSDPSRVDHSDPDDEHGNAAKIIHVENDLRERLARLFSRWMPERQEDFAGRVARLQKDFPDPEKPPRCHEDVVCYFLPPEISTVTTWQWFMPDVTGGNFTDKANDIRSQTLPTDEDENPFQNAPLDTLKRIFPKLELPITTKLDIPRPTP